MSGNDQRKMEVVKMQLCKRIHEEGLGLLRNCGVREKVVIRVEKGGLDD